MISPAARSSRPAPEPVRCPAGHTLGEIVGGDTYISDHDGRIIVGPIPDRIRCNGRRGKCGKWWTKEDRRKSG